MFQEVKRLLPPLSPWVESCYGTASVLNFGATSISSTAGVQQGDPLGPLLFSLILQPVIEKIQEEAEDLIQNSWYLDDGILVGTKEALIKVWDLLVELGVPRGLHLSLEKSLVYCPDYDLGDSDPIERGVKRVEGVGFKLLGAPLGEKEYEEQLLEKRLADNRHLLDSLHLLEDPHLEYTLLKNCFAFPKFAFSLRTTDTSRHLHLLEAFDGAVRGALEGIIGSPLSPPQWQQASLPVAKGGLGLRAARKHGAAAYLASLSASQIIVQDIRIKQVVGQMVASQEVGLAGADNPLDPPVELVAAIQDLNAQLGDPLSYGEVVAMTQRSLSALVDAESSSRLIQGATDVRDLARLKCLEREGAGDWLCAYPSKALGLHLRKSEFVAASSTA